MSAVLFHLTHLVNFSINPKVNGSFPLSVLGTAVFRPGRLGYSPMLHLVQAGIITESCAFQVSSYLCLVNGIYLLI